MKITPNSHLSPLLPQPPTQTPPPLAVSTPDLRQKKPAHRKPPRRKTPILHTKKDTAAAPSGKRVGPPTPLLRWKFDEVDDKEGGRDFFGNGVVAGGDKSAARRGGKGGGGTVSARKLAAALWRWQAPVVDAGRQEPRRSMKEDDRLGLQPQASFKFSNFAMEGATKWDPVCPEKSEEEPRSFQFFDQDQNQNTASMVSDLQSELGQARKRIEELELEHRSSKKKVKQFLVKLSEERAAWRSREHEKVRAIISDVKAELIRERKNCQRLEVVNSKLVNEVNETKLALKRYIQDFEKERKNRELVEEVCDELAKEIGEDKAEVDALKTECMKIREEVDDERKMLQMAEVWREERVQMKLIDAKVMIEDKYSQMNKLIAHLERFLGSKSGEMDQREIKEAGLLQKAAASVKVQDVKEFSYEPPKLDDMFSILKEMGMGGSERQIEPCDSCSPRSHDSKIHNRSSEAYTLRGDQVYRLSNAYGSQNDDLDDDGSGWETASHADDQGSSFTPDGSVVSLNKMIASLNKMGHRESNVSGSGTEWEGNGGDETPGTEVSEVSSVRSKSSKKMSSISRLWRSGPKNGDSYRVISVDGMDGRLSNADGSMSPDHGCSKGRNTPSDLGVQWSSPVTGISQMGRGRKGCMEWPRGQKNSLKTQLLEARVESQKIQLRQVLKQKT